MIYSIRLLVVAEADTDVRLADTDDNVIGDVVQYEDVASVEGDAMAARDHIQLRVCQFADLGVVTHDLLLGLAPLSARTLPRLERIGVSWGPTRTLSANVQKTISRDAPVVSFWSVT
jgi:hypothetical protein